MRAILVLLSLILSLAQTASAATIQATGISLIQDGDLESARTRAVQRATEQASLLAMAQVAVTQSVRDGILEIDNLRVSTQTSIGEVRVLSETRSGDQLEVLIEAEITPAQGCADDNSATAYRKSIALTHWTLKRPADANWGRLQSLSTDLPGYLLTELEPSAHLKLVDARQLRLTDYQEINAAAAQLRAKDGAQLNAQYILSAQIESLAMARQASDTPNVLIDLIEKTGLKPRDEDRIFALRVDLIEAQTGDLLQRYRINTSGAWTAPMQSAQATSFSRFSAEPYGQAVLAEIRELAHKISESLACAPLKAEVITAAGSSIWIDKGTDAGINVGDRLSVARRLQLYDAQMQPTTSVEPTDLTLVIERTEFNRAQGRLSMPSDLAGIQPGDIVIGY